MYSYHECLTKVELHLFESVDEQNSLLELMQEAVR